MADDHRHLGLRSGFVDPVREAERILRGRRRWGWAAVLACGAAMLGLIVLAAPVPVRPVRASTTTVVVHNGESSPWCAEAVAETGGQVWSTISDRMDQVHLPLRGKLHVINAAGAVFTTHRVRVRLSPAMPCTPG